MGFNPLSTTETERQWVETHWRKSKIFTLTKYNYPTCQLAFELILRVCAKINAPLHGAFLTSCFVVKLVIYPDKLLIPRLV